MLYLLVQVNEGPKSIIPERIMSIESESNQFFDLFDTATLGQYEDREVKVFIRREKSEGCLHETIGKTFIIHLASAIWYIDPHLLTLSAHSYHLPALFKQLKTYQDGRSYNEFYYTGHHKKVPLSQQKLAHISNSLEISISQPWASNNRWSQVMPAVLSLIEILKKYLNYLITTNASMNELHHSNESARSPENNSTMYRVTACEPYQLKDEYIQLNDLLLEKSVY
ncbi:17629_t:CDS:2 [Cetraspora pellucida]|uniref:17629_t:CDS:1 n=1 Tax=Cetraspora pellucida TaxID=1433469 RepID=A0ACA9L2A6_9GLOM|nr:17629_t:CDS:2 [Cetraspora pellucida]